MIDATGMLERATYVSLSGPQPEQTFHRYLFVYKTFHATLCKMFFSSVIRIIYAINKT